jgi:hypothetical protein
MFDTVTEGMHQNVGALHATDRMCNKDTDLTEGGILRLLFRASCGIGVLCTLTRFLCRQVSLITTGVRLHAKIASGNSDRDVGKPGQLRWKFLLQHEVVMMMPTKGPPKKNDTLVWERHDRVFPRMLFFFPR